MLIEQTQGNREGERASLATLGPHLVDGAIVYWVPLLLNDAASPRHCHCHCFPAGLRLRGRRGVGLQVRRRQGSRRLSGRALRRRAGIAQFRHRSAGSLHSSSPAAAGPATARVGSERVEKSVRDSARQADDRRAGERRFIRNGMSEAEVVQRLGRPDVTSGQPQKRQTLGLSAAAGRSRHDDDADASGRQRRRRRSEGGTLTFGSRCLRDRGRSVLVDAVATGSMPSPSTSRRRWRCLS